ncbi:MAG: DoxX family protein [Nocardioidaceae bacterium]
MSIVRLVARPMLASMFISGGINALRNPERLAKRAQPVIEKLHPLIDRATAPVPLDFDEQMLVRTNGLVHVVAGAMLATGRAPRLASVALLATMVPTTLGGHRFWEESDPQLRAGQRTHFLKNISMAGGLLLASVDTEGRPSLAWRAGNQARKARKHAGKLTSN